MNHALQAAELEPHLVLPLRQANHLDGHDDNGKYDSAVPYEDRIVAFKADLVALDAAALVTRYILADECAALLPAQHHSLKTRISGKFSLPTSAISVVGSSKLGFSIAPGKRYRSFGDSSDIDVALVSNELYVRVWKELFDYERSGAYWKNKDECLFYTFRGWIRPDKLPRTEQYPFAKLWWDFFESLGRSQEFGPYRISAGLYHSDHFFHAYQRICVEQCKQEQELQ